MKPERSFIKGRLRSLKYTLSGAFLLIRTEHSIITQIAFGLVAVYFGFFFGITKTEWMFQVFGIGLVLTAESLNTAIEKLCDFVHPDYHKQIGLVKDIAAGAMTFAAGAALIIVAIIYYSYVAEMYF